MKPDFDAIRARCKAATSGPWRVSTYTSRDGTTVVNAITGVSEPKWADYGEGEGEWFADTLTLVETDSGVYGPTMPDAQFIAHARTDIPALLVYIDGLERERDEARAEVQRLKARPAEAEIGRLDGMWQTLVRERDEARRLLELAHLGRAQLEGWRDGLERERDEARAEVERLRAESKTEQAFTNKYIKRLHDAEAKGRDAYRRGAEAMREACAVRAQRYLGLLIVEGAKTAEAIRALPIPEEP